MNLFSRKGSFRLILPLLGTMVGCANTPVPVDSKSTVQQTTSSDTAPTDYEAKVRSLVSQDPMFAILAAELANQRGDTRSAVIAYTEAAKQLKDPELAKRAVELSLGENDPEHALAAAKEWEQLDPTNAQASRTVLLLQLSTNQVDEALPALTNYIDGLRKLEAEHPGLSGVSPNKVALEMILRIPNKVKAYETGIKLFGDKADDAENQYLLAQLAFASDLYDEANRHIDAVIKLKPEEERNYIFLAQILDKKEGTPEASQALLAKQANLHPKWFSTRLYLARAYTQTNNWDKARDSFAELIQLQPKNYPLYSSQGFVMAKLENRKEAEKNFKIYLKNTSVDERQNEPLIFLTLSGLALDEKDYAGAIKWLNAAPYNKEDLDIQLRLSTVYEKQGKISAAKKVLDQFQAQNEDDGIRLTLAKSQLAERMNKPDQAVEVMDKGLNTYPDQPDLLYERAMLSERQEDMASVEQYLRKLIEVKPDNPHGYNALGYTFAEKGIRLDEALTLIQKAVSLAPNDPYILDSLGWIQYRMGKNEEAEKTLQKAFTTRPDEEIGAHLLEVLVQADKKQEAKEFSDQLTTRFPDSDKIKPWTEKAKAL